MKSRIIVELDIEDGAALPKRATVQIVEIETPEPNPAEAPKPEEKVQAELNYLRDYYAGA